ncbi:hypothetical protein D9757_013358 [Collybiopsis confluens]|uniref:Uncharacterized protein n=1 Tax=Collybiopsis confluens TaxID=2823264 RepID=A0A8H5CUM0_9AGAR|nr:hypothetical protein D9757_013358 [Collybiopsis confluens]
MRVFDSNMHPNLIDTAVDFIKLKVRGWKYFDQLMSAEPSEYPVDIWLIVWNRHCNVNDNHRTDNVLSSLINHFFNTGLVIRLNIRKQLREDINQAVTLEPLSSLRFKDGSNRQFQTQSALASCIEVDLDI